MAVICHGLVKLYYSKNNIARLMKHSRKSSFEKSKAHTPRKDLKDHLFKRHFYDKQANH